jgi:hypothetical protein
VPTYDATQAFRRAFAKLDARTAAAFMAAVAMFVAELAARGFAPPFHPRLRVHKLAGLDLWAISFADGMRAVFRIAPPVVEGQVHIVWEFIGDHDAYDRFCRAQ